MVVTTYYSIKGWNSFVVLYVYMYILYIYIYIYMFILLAHPICLCVDLVKLSQDEARLGFRSLFRVFIMFWNSCNNLHYQTWIVL